MWVFIYRKITPGVVLPPYDNFQAERHTAKVGFVKLAGDAVRIAAERIGDGGPLRLPGRADPPRQPEFRATDDVVAGEAVADILACLREPRRFLVPVVQVAWAEGGVTAAERGLISRLARARGIQDGSAADRQLADWLDRRPGVQVFAQATRLIRAMLAVPGPGDLSADDLVGHCESIADASGGMLGIIGRVSAEERGILAIIAAGLKGRASGHRESA